MDRNGREMEGVALADENQSNLATTDASGIATFAMAPGSEVAGDSPGKITRIAGDYTRKEASYPVSSGRVWVSSTIKSPTSA